MTDTINTGHGTMRPRVGFIGLGDQGLPMAAAMFARMRSPTSPPSWAAPHPCSTASSGAVTPWPGVPCRGHPGLRAC